MQRPSIRPTCPSVTLWTSTGGSVAVQVRGVSPGLLQERHESRRGQRHRRGHTAVIKAEALGGLPGGSTAGYLRLIAVLTGIPRPFGAVGSPESGTGPGCAPPTEFCHCPWRLRDNWCLSPVPAHFAKIGIETGVIQSYRFTRKIPAARVLGP